MENCPADPIDTGCVKQFFYNMDWFDGQLGRIKFDSNGDVLGVPYSEWQIVGGEIKEIKRLQIQ